MSLKKWGKIAIDPRRPAPGWGGKGCPLARPAAGAACLPRHAHASSTGLCTIHTFVCSLHRYVPEALQGAERVSGYPCLDRPLIVACRCHRSRGNGIQSFGVCLQLQDASHQDSRGRLDAFGCVQRLQDVQAVSDFFLCQTFCNQLVNFFVVQN